MKRTRPWLIGLDLICQSSLIVSSIAILLMVAGCSHMPLGSMVKLSRLDPMQAEPVHMRVAVRSPDWLRIRQGGANLHLAASLSDPKQKQETIDETFELVESPVHDLPAKLAAEMAPSDHVAIFRIKPDDLPRLYAAKNAIRQLKQAYPDGVRGSLSVHVGGCRITSATPQMEREAKVHIYLKTEPQAPFLPLVRNYQVLQLVKGQQAGAARSATLNRLPLCSG